MAGSHGAGGGEALRRISGPLGVPPVSLGWARPQAEVTAGDPHTRPCVLMTLHPPDGPEGTSRILGRRSR